MGIVKYESFLSENLFLEAKDFVQKLVLNRPKNQGKLITSIDTWPDYLILKSTPILKYMIDNTESDLMYKIKKEVETKIPYFVNTITVHIMPNLSYIPWHNDGHVKAALSLYLNDEWNENWGGYLMYKNDETIEAIKPKKNLAVLQKSGIFHSVSTVNIDSEYRYSLQFFLTNEKSII